MDIGDLNVKNIGKGLLGNKAISNFVNEFIKELGDYLSNNMKMDNTLINNQYSKYWDYQNFIEDNVAANIGLSRYGSNVIYYNNLCETVDKSILEISEKEGTLYRKQFFSNGSNNGGFYNIEKYENGKISKIKIKKEVIPQELENDDLIFQYQPDGDIKIRDDLKHEIINLASKNSQYLREKEQKVNQELKKEGHIYEAFEDDGYVFLNDLTEERNFSVEDIDFATNVFDGDGKYQVINGEYTKID